MKNRRMLCWLLLLTLLYTQIMVMSVSPAYARYDSRVIADAVVETRAHGMTSNCMVKAGDPSLTVLVGKLDEAKRVSFWLKSNGSDAVGSLLWSVSNPDHLQYVQITMQIDNVIVDPGEKIDLLRDVPMSFDMTIAPTAIARDTVHEELKIHVVVTWGDEMWGTFQVILPEVVKEEEPAVPETNPETPNAEGENGEGISASTSESDTTPEPETQPADSWLQYPIVPAAEAEETTEPTEPEVVSPDDPLQLKTISRFDPAYSLPVKITVSEDITSVRLGLEVTDGEETRFEPFPDYTMFSLDQGGSYYMLYDGYITELSLQDGSSIPVLLDFTHTDLQEGDTLVLAMEAYADGQLMKTRRAETVADARESSLTLVHPLDAETQAVAFSEGDTRETAAAAGDFGWRSRTLSYDNALEYVFPMEWLDAEVEYSVEMLTMTEEQTLEYIPATLSETGLSAKYQDFDLTHNLVLQIGEEIPQAGTYRLNMKWSYEGICFANMQTTFFINYSAYVTQALGG